MYLTFNWILTRRNERRPWNS